MRSPRARFAAALCAVASLLAFPAGAERYAHGLLFEIKRDGTPASYVFGTLHSSDPRVLDLPGPVRDAFGHARRLTVENVLGEAQASTFLEQAQYPDAHRLSDDFDAATVDRIREALGTLAPSAPIFERLKPWAILLLLSRPRGEDGTPALDQQLVSEARTRHMLVLGLELPEEQASAFDAIPIESQVALVRYALDRRETVLADQERALRAWLDRDLEGLAVLLREPGRRDSRLAPHLAELKRHLIDDRSALMAHRLFLPLREGRIFVAVGALHLYGDRGLLALIAEQGYRVRRLY